MYDKGPHEEVVGPLDLFLHWREICKNEEGVLELLKPEHQILLNREDIHRQRIAMEKKDEVISDLRQEVQWLQNDNNRLRHKVNERERDNTVLFITGAALGMGL